MSEVNYGLDSIEDYLQTELVSAIVVKASGGPLRYWESQTGPTDRPRLAKFAISYLTAPGKVSLVQMCHELCAKVINVQPLRWRQNVPSPVDI